MKTFDQIKKKLIEKRAIKDKEYIKRLPSLENRIYPLLKEIESKDLREEIYYLKYPYKMTSRYSLGNEFCGTKLNGEWHGELFFAGEGITFNKGKISKVRISIDEASEVFPQEISLRFFIQRVKELLENLLTPSTSFEIFSDQALLDFIKGPNFVKFEYYKRLNFLGYRNILKKLTLKTPVENPENLKALRILCNNELEK